MDKNKQKRLTEVNKKLSEALDGEKKLNETIKNQNKVSAEKDGEIKEYKSRYDSAKLNESKVKITFF